MEQRPGVGDDALHLFESLHTLIVVATSYLRMQLNRETKIHAYSTLAKLHVVVEEEKKGRTNKQQYVYKHENE